MGSRLHADAHMRTNTSFALVPSECRAAQGAQSGLYTSFPYCQCKKSPSAYKLGDVVVAKGNNQYCFKLSAKVPAGCTDYCCTKADLKKIEVSTWLRLCQKVERECRRASQ